MKDAWVKKWNDRYKEEAFAYGTAPNEFFKAQIQSLEPGTILLGAEGEGRNAVYAAQLGWEVSAFDISVEGKNKALQLVEEHQVSIDYQVGLLPDLGYEAEQFDALALIYAHFPPPIKSDYHQRLAQMVKKGGLVIFEAFGKNHLKYRQQNPKVGGPGVLEALFSTEELEADFVGYEVLELVEQEVALRQGIYHNGTGSVVRFVGRRKA